MKKIKKNTSQAREFTIGIDLGGTKVAVGLVDSSGRLVAETSAPTVPKPMRALDPRLESHPSSSAEVRRHISYVTRTIAQSSNAVLHTAFEKGRISRHDEILGVGLASAGPMDLEKGTLEHPANFKGWKTVSLVKLVKEQMEAEFAPQHLRMWKSRRITFQNDAIAAALGEGWVGGARGCETFVMITVGTGIGTGVILNGRPAQSRGMGSEWGHMIVDSASLLHHCQKAGQKDGQNVRHDAGFCEVEGHASGTWLVKRARQLGLEISSAGELASAAQAGDPLALQCWENGASALAALLYSLSLGFHPEKFVFGGGMMALKEHFFPRTQALYSQLIKARNPAFLTKLQISQLGNRAGFIGAARLPYLDPK